MSGDNGSLDLKEREESASSADDFERDFGSRFSDAEKGKINSLSKSLAKNDPSPEVAVSPTSTTLVASAQTSKAKAAMQLIRAFAGRRSTQVGGGVAGLIVSVMAVFGFFGASLEVVNVRENMIQKANKFAKAAFEHRRNANFYKVVRKINNGELRDKVTPQQFADHFRARGFDVEIVDDKIKTLTYSAEIDGKKQSRSVDLTAKDAKKQLGTMFDKSEFGRVASLQFGKATDTMAGFFKGPEPRGLYRAMGLRFGNWLDTKNASSDKAETPREKFANQLRHANEVDSEIAAHQAADSKEQLANENKTDTNGDGKIDSKDSAPSILGDAADAVDGAEEYRQRLLDNPKDPGNVAGIENAALEAVEKHGGDIVATAAEEVGKDPSKILNGKRLAQSISLTGYYQTACTVNGTLKFVANIQNILLSYELAKFSFRFLTAADEQKGGIVSSEGIKLLALYLNSPDPITGKTAMQSGGMLTTIFRNPGSPPPPPSAANLARYGTGRAPQGILGTVSSYVNGVMDSLGGVKGCRIVNNGYVQAGSLVVGLGVAVFSGGTSAILEAIPQMAIAIAGQVALEIGTVMLVQAAAGMPLTGYESGEQAGDALASGWGKGRGMVSNKNGMRPSTKKQLALMNEDIEANQQVALSRQSVFERYLSPSNGDSMLVQTAAMSAGYMDIHTFGPRLMASIARIPSTIMGMFGPRVAFADTQQNCDDPQYPIIKDNDLQTDVFCNLEFASTPDLDADETEGVMRSHNMIDEQGNPIANSEYQKYIDLCLSGRPDVLYSPEISQDGNDEGPVEFKLDSGQSIKNACLSTTAGPALPGDSVGRFDRYANWYGYMVDEHSMVEEISGDFQLSLNELMQQDEGYALAR